MFHASAITHYEYSFEGSWGTRHISKWLHNHEAEQMDEFRTSSTFTEWKWSLQILQKF